MGLRLPSPAGPDVPPRKRVRISGLVAIDTHCASPPAVGGTTGALTFRVTDNGRGEGDAVERTLIVLVYVPAVSPAGLTDTATLPGIVPLSGETVSQLSAGCSMRNGALAVWLFKV